MPDVKVPDWVFKTPLHGVRLLQDDQGGQLECDGDYLETVKLIFPQHHAPIETKSLWRLADIAERYTSTIELFDGPTSKLLQIECEGKGVFQYQKDSINIVWQNEGTGFEHYLQTVGLSLWLEMRGVLCIHANAIATDRGVIGVIAPSQTGKTTLTAALATRGMAMMTDDMMAIHKSVDGWKVYAGWPQVRMWPQVAQHFVKNSDNLARVHSRFEKRIVDLKDQDRIRHSSKSGLLKRLYLLERLDDNDAEVVIKPVTAAESVMSLLQNSMLADAYRPMAIEESRLIKLALMLESVEVRRVVYPSGKEHLARVCESIEADVKTF